jgi:manganese/zinc/iron transport system permease protein
MLAFWTILTASLVAVACALLGCYLVLRKMAMVSDAISHSILPGLLLAFLITGSRDSVTMLVGAAALGLLTTLIIEFLHRKGNLQSDAAIGVTFTALFAIGIILITIFAEKVDFDQECVLYGEIAYTPLDEWILPNGYSLGARTAWLMGTILLLVLAFISLAYKELLMTSFDASFALAIGISSSLWHYALMGMVSLVTVTAFEAVGAILVVALLICPAATAYLLTQRINRMLWLSALIGVLIAVLGYYLAVWIDGSVAGAMATVAGLLFLLALLFSPVDGVWKNKWQKAN